jgi:hypothetical protein
MKKGVKQGARRLAQGALAEFSQHGNFGVFALQ